MDHTRFIDEYGLLDEFSVPPYGYYESIDEIMLGVMEPLIKHILSTMMLELHDGNNVQYIDAKKHFDYVWDYFYDGENFYCKVASLMRDGIVKFLYEGKWHIGMLKGNFDDCNVEFLENNTDYSDEEFRPVMYFGFDEPLALWTIDPTYNEDILSWDDELEVDDILSDDSSRCVSMWANECGIYFPRRSECFSKSPITINANMSCQELLVSINKYIFSR